MTNLARALAPASLGTLLGLTLLAASCTEYEIQPEPSDVQDVADVPIPEDEPTGGIRGRICAPDGTTWVVGAEVSAVHAYGTTSAVTGQDGWFELTEIPVGAYTVTITKGSFSSDFAVEVVEDQITTLPEDQCLEQGDVRMAIVPGIYDHIETILASLQFQYDVVSPQILADPSAMEQYDILFFNCGMPDGWWAHAEPAGQNLADYVANGGSIYASDWAYYIIEAAFPGHNTFLGDDARPGDAYVGEETLLTGTVLDANIAGTLGATSAQLNYDLPAWAAVQSTETGEVLIEGTFPYYDYTSGPGTHTGPLATRLHSGDGTAVYTSFHNETQTTVDMILILQEIILSL